MPKTLRFFIPLIVLLLSACSFSLAEDIEPPTGSQQQPAVQATSETISGPVYPMVPPNPAQGAQDFAEKCAPCHGEIGLGDGSISSRSAVPVAAIGTAEIARVATPVEWYILVAEGDLERGMPPFNSLTDRQKWDVIAYIYQLSVTPEELALGEDVYVENCASCHGESGQGDGPQAAQLSAVPTDFTEQQVMARLSAEMMFETISNGIGGLMPGFSQLDQAERWALTSYLRSFSYAKTAGAVSAEPTSTASSSLPTVEVKLEATEQVTSTTPSASFGVVTVDLINGSGGPLPPKTPVTLYGFDNMLNVFSTTLTTNSAGVYLFANVEMVPGRAFIASADYQGGTYGSDVVVAEGDLDELSLQVVVYESSSDISQLVMDRAHIFFEFTQEGVVQVVEVFIISNPTEYAIVSKETGGAVVSFQLPEEAVGLQFQDGILGERYLQIPGGFADTVTIQPGTGQYQVVYAYNMLYDDELEFSQPMTLDTSAVVIMLPDIGVKVKGENISDDGLRDMQGTAYRIYTATGLQAGSPLEFSLSGKVRTGGQVVTTNSSSSTIAIGLGVFGLALVGAGVWLYLRNRKQQAAELPDELEVVEQTASESQREDPTTLIDAIIALDDQYKAGKIPEEAYMQRRDELKQRLERSTSNQE